MNVNDAVIARVLLLAQSAPDGVGSDRAEDLQPLR
jgi:hypothetical protein